MLEPVENEEGNQTEAAKNGEGLEDEQSRDGPDLVWANNRASAEGEAEPAAGGPAVP
jgi:hypothetical protein